MKNFTLAILFCSLISFSQTQIGSDIDGEAAYDLAARVNLSADGTTIAIGATGNDGNGSNSGHVRVYENQSGNWLQIGQDIDGEASNDSSGISVCLSSDGNIVAIGAGGNDANGSVSGHVRVFQNQSGNWVQVGQDINGEAANDGSGVSVSLSSDGSIVAIGATGNDGNGTNSGHVRVYQNQSGTWTQIGQDIDGEAANDQSGVSVSLSSDGSIVAIGSKFNDGNGASSGHVRVYQNQSGNWIQLGQDIDGETSGDESGSSISLSSNGSIIAIGARLNDQGSDKGHVRVYEYSASSWTQIGSDIDGETNNDQSGTSISLSADGSILAIGAPYNVNDNGNSGSVRIFKYSGVSWNQIGVDIDGTVAGDRFGNYVSLSSDGSIVAIGADLNSNNGTSSGNVQLYDLSSILSNEDFRETYIKVHPNPTKNTLTIQLNNNTEFKEANLYNSLGQFVNTYNSNVLNLSGLSKGFYFLEIETNKGTTNKKIIKK